MLRVSNLEVAFRSGGSIVFPDLDVRQPSLILIGGASGVGKSTFLAAIGGLLRPTRGEVVFEGTDLAQLRRWQVDHWRARKVGVVPQRLHFISDLTVLENVELAAWAAGLRATSPDAEALLVRVGLGERLHHLPSQLSVGQSARLAIARALVSRPKLLLVDEPTANLDAGMAQQVIQLLDEVRLDLRATLLIATHDARLLTALGDHAWTYHL